MELEKTNEEPRVEINSSNSNCPSAQKTSSLPLSESESVQKESSNNKNEQTESQSVKVEENTSSNNKNNPKQQTEPQFEKIEQSVTSEAKEDPDTERARFVHYEGDVAVYIDPQSRQQYIWDKEKNEWKLQEINYEFDGTNYFYKDKSGTKFKWDTVSNSWVNQAIPSVTLVPYNELVDSDNEEEYDENNARKTAPPVQRQDMSKGSYGYEDDTHTYTDATDGTVYLWNKEKNAWFPKVDDDFLARYQMSYGFIDPTSNVPEKPAEDAKKVEIQLITPPDENVKTSEEKIISGQKRKPEPPKWFDVGEESTKVYVSNLPLDLTQEEFVDLMQKCGLVMKEVDTNGMKVKLYTDPFTKKFKGDALCTYIKRESVDLALNILDGHELRGKKIKVERAKFTMKGEAYDPKLKPKKKRKKDLEKLKKAQEKLFDWRPDKMRGERGKNESVIVVKNLFDPAHFDKDVTLILEYQQDLREECSKCGHVKKVTIHDKHPDGVAQIFFKEPEAADACKELLNGRWFGQRQITADTWDGKTRYRMQETQEEREARLKKWETFLEEEDRKKKESESRLDEQSISKKPTEEFSNEMDVEEKSDDGSERDTNSRTEEDNERGGDSDATRSSGESEGEG